MTGTTVLVAAASRHGATAGIADAIGRWLPETDAGRALSLTTVVHPPDADLRPDAFDAVVAGSAVYLGRWLEPARVWIGAHASALRSRPVWLFSSGPIGQPPFPAEDPHDVGPLGELVHPRGHRVFPGRLDRSLLSFGERAMVTGLRAPEGDFRDWPAVRAWCTEIAEELAALPR